MRTYLIAAGLALALPGFASAIPCTSDADCGPGELCETSGECPPCPGDGSPCDDTCTTSSACVSYESEAPAVAGPVCAADADCPYGFGCIEVQVGGMGCDCACPGCEAGVECPPCECGGCVDTPPTSELRCVFIAAACDTATDCAGGFECAAQEVCSGGGGSGCACPGCEPGTECPPCDCPPPADPAPDQCTTVAAWCLPPQIACMDAAACPTDWTCEAMEMGGSCDCACACDPSLPDCGPCDCGCPEPTVESYCLPPGWAAILDQLVPIGDDGSGGSQEGAVDFEAGQTPRATNGAEAEGGGSAGGDAAEDEGAFFGCSAGPGRAGLAFLALGLAALLARRRR